MDRKNPYESSPADSASPTSYDTADCRRYNAPSSSRIPEASSSSYADVKDVVTADDAAPPPYCRYAVEEAQPPSLPQTSRPSTVQQQSSSQYQPTPSREHRTTQYQAVPPTNYQVPQSQAAQAAQAATQQQRQSQPQYPMDQPQCYNDSNGYGRMGRREMRRERGGGPLRMLMEARHQGSAQPTYGYDDRNDYGRGRRGMRRRNGGGGPIGLLVGEALKRF